MPLLRQWAELEARRRGPAGAVVCAVVVAFLMERFRAPLLAAIEKGSADVAKLLLARGADVDKAAADGRTPLLAASGRGNADVLGLLLDGGADVDKAALDGRTPLLVAYEASHTDVVRTLIARGADVESVMRDAAAVKLARVRQLKGHTDSARPRRPLGVSSLRALF